MKGFFINRDTYLESLNLNERLKGFLESFIKIFNEKIVDEVFVVKYEQNIVTPLYFFCDHSNCHNSDEITEEKKERIEKEKMSDFDFFVNNIISKQCLINNEGIIAKDQMGGLFDAVFRMDNYYIGLNNSQSSFRELKEKLGVTEELFIKIVKNLYLELRK